MSVFSDVFHLEEQRRFHPDSRPDLFALFDILLIVVLLGLVGSRFFFFPGTSVLLPETTAPFSQVLVANVVTLKRNGAIIYRESFLKLSEFELALASDASLLSAGTSPLILLVKADALVPLGTFLKVSALAKKYGYSNVQIAQKTQRPHEK